jgi:hypothetical protein
MALVFPLGVVLGVIAMVSMASNREDRLGTLTRQPPDLLARGARRLNGVGLRNITPRGITPGGTAPRETEDVRR